jgi:hypothetical protein
VAPGGVTCQRCRSNNKWQKRQTKAAVIRSYTHGAMCCPACGETRTECLTLDHVNQDGAARRLEQSGGKKRRGGGDVLYRSEYARLKTSPLDPTLRVLCFNCNISAYRNGGTPAPFIRREPATGAVIEGHLPPPYIPVSVPSKPPPVTGRATS